MKNASELKKEMGHLEDKLKDKFNGQTSKYVSEFQKKQEAFLDKIQTMLNKLKGKAENLFK
ncbi:MAG TPA: hypothetical protein VNZ86_15425 [Bacteroidia bacterium]|nr:hypothetical protein [Bacteroidia bacterium]